VVKKAELLDRQLEEGPPLPEVAVIGREGDRNVAMDVEEHESGGLGNSRVGEGIGGA
jgi:hypothetical protein